MPKQKPESPLLHITAGDEWDRQHRARQGSGFSDPSLQSEGFIHCSTRDQVLIPANERFAGRDDLVLLIIDEERVTSPVRYEDCYQSGTAFPHVYGPIDWDAVVDVVDFPYDPVTGFVLPDGLEADSADGAS